MATIKSYTDLEQSQKLAEILPIESADMNWHELPSIGLFTRAFPYKHDNGATEGILPCWSLAALFNALPKIGAEEPMVMKLYYANEPKERYVCQYNLTNMTSEYDNPIDACVEMIIKLNEQNLLRLWK